MQNSRTTAGETATLSRYPKRVRIFSPDGHASRDIIATADDESTERFLRNHASRIGRRISVRPMTTKPANPTCDNCASMTIRQTTDGANHRYCEMHGQWIPDEEHAPVCNLHQAIAKFENRFSRKGGAA